jgi:hypothetical protein
MHLSAASAERTRAHLYSQLLCLGRHTITGLLTTQGRIHQDWSADYRLYSRARLEPEALFGCVRQEVRAQRKEGDPLVLALDDSLLRKRGPRAHGVKWLRDPLGPPFSVNFVRGQRVVQFSAALQSGPAQARMVPVDFQHAPAPPKVPAQADAQQRAAIEARRKEENINAVAARRLDHLVAQESCPVITVCDGRFANRTFLRAAPKETTVITRIRKDTALFWPVEQQPPTGRRRIYGQRAPTPEELRVDESKTMATRARLCLRTNAPVQSQTAPRRFKPRLGRTRLPAFGDRSFGLSATGRLPIALPPAGLLAVHRSKALAAPAPAILPMALGHRGELPR